MSTMNNYDPNQPIILGLAGKAATGKTSVAEAIVPKAQINVEHEDMIWDHIFFALPLYEMATIRHSIKGLRERDRQLYSLHSVVYDLFGGTPIGNVPPYEDLIALVSGIYSMKIEPEDTKPRSFLQKTGDICRALDEDCFAKWAIMKSKSLFNNYIRGNDDIKPFCVIVSDVRFVNEAEHILAQPNGILVCYEASDEVRDARILGRDGRYMTDEQKNHKSEKQIDLVRDLASAIINTDNMSIQEQTKQTIEAVNAQFGVYA